MLPEDRGFLRKTGANNVQKVAVLGSHTTHLNIPGSPTTYIRLQSTYHQPVPIECSRV
jgi:hypothetical protein